MPRFSLKQLMVATAVIALGIAAVTALYNFVEPFNDMPFTQAVWANGDKATRAQMSADLVNNYLPIGMLKSQVEALIGKADRVIGPGDQHADLHLQGAEAHEYNIDGGHILALFTFVCVNYDANGRVIDARIASDD